MFRLVNQANEENNLSISDKWTKFEKEGDDWYKRAEWSRKRVVDPNNGYLVNDTIIIEASLGVFVKNHTITLE